MKNTSLYFILGLISLLIGSQFLMQGSGYNTTDMTPAHLLIALGVLLLLYCFVGFFYQLQKMTPRKQNEEKTKDEDL